MYHKLMRECLSTKALMDSVAKDALEFIKNKDNPLGRRWTLYCRLIRYGIWREQDWSVLHLSVLDEMGFYDDLERYSEQSFPDVFDYIWERLTCDESLSKKEQYEKAYKLQEEMMQSGYSGFQYDWW